MKILLAIDGSTFSERAVQAVMAQTKPNHADVRILHVVEPIPEYADGLAWGYGLQSASVGGRERASSGTSGQGRWRIARRGISGGDGG
jgi:hypothetical protein